MSGHRKSIRLKGYDYSKNWYYLVTICCENRKNIFGKIGQIKIENVGAGLVPALMEKKMILGNVGTMVEKIIVEYFIKNKFIELDEYVLMPDHVHMIVVIKNKFNNVGAGLVPAKNNNEMVGTNIRATTGINIRATTIRAGIKPAPTNNKTLGMIIGELKSLTTNEYIKNVKENNWPKFEKRLWQRNFFERIIRNEKEYLGYKKYIKNNPINFDK